jgi:Right handed beta helix region
MFKIMSVALLAAISSFPFASSAQTAITLLPYVIKTPGLYVLDKSLTYSSPGFAAIIVNSGNVTIDLQGFSISNPGTVSSSIGIFAVNVGNVTVQNGSIVSFAEGIKFQSEGGSELTSELIQNVRFDHIKNIAVVLLESRNSIVRNCQISGTGYDLANVVIHDAVGIGINDRNSRGGNQLIDNNISGAKQTGILLGSNDLSDGNFISNAPSGIISNDISSKLKNNTVNQSAVPYTGGTQLPGTNF